MSLVWKSSQIRVHVIESAYKSSQKVSIAVCWICNAVDSIMLNLLLSVRVSCFSACDKIYSQVEYMELCKLCLMSSFCKHDTFCTYERHNPHPTTRRAFEQRLNGNSIMQNHWIRQLLWKQRKNNRCCCTFE